MQIGHKLRPESFHQQALYNAFSGAAHSECEIHKENACVCENSNSIHNPMKDEERERERIAGVAEIAIEGCENCNK